MKFTEAFPEVKNLTISIVENGNDTHLKKNNEFIITMDNVDDYISQDEDYPCCNRKCNYQSGYNIFDFMVKILRNHKTNIYGRIACMGSHASVKGDTINSRCMNTINIKSVIEYAE